MSFPEITCVVITLAAVTSRKASSTYIIRSPLNSLPDLGVHAVANIDNRSGLLEDTKRLDEWRW